jgi:hypothetical protein
MNVSSSNNDTEKMGMPYSDQHMDEKVQFYHLNMFVCCLVFPLGLASILNSVSAYWMAKVQQMQCITKLQMHVTLQVNGILAGSAILSTLVFALLLLPVGINSIHVTTDIPCYTGAVMNIISTITLAVIGIPSITSAQRAYYS